MSGRSSASRPRRAASCESSWPGASPATRHSLSRAALVLPILCRCSATSEELSSLETEGGSNRMQAPERLGREQGFTLIELLVVIVIIGILLAIAVPSYLGFKNRANQKAADADVRAALPSAEGLYSDNGSYAALSPSVLQSYDTGVKIDHAAPKVGDSQTYCMDKTV